MLNNSLSPHYQPHYGKRQDECNQANNQGDADHVALFQPGSHLLRLPVRLLGGGFAWRLIFESINFRGSHGRQTHRIG